MSSQRYIQTIVAPLNAQMRKIVIALLRGLSRITYALRAMPNSTGKSPIQKSNWRKSTLKRFKSNEISSRNHETFLLDKQSSAQNIIDTSRLCYQNKGIYPISFSVPTYYSNKDGGDIKERLLSHVIPGEAYAYNSLQDYLNQYSTSVFGLTHKKGGWDCFRHLEIISTGCLPVMPDIEFCPEFTMVHYPKAEMAQVVRAFERGRRPDPSVYEFFSSWAQAHLSSRSMMRQIFEVLGKSPKRLLFFDQALPLRADYLSVFALIGLLQNEDYHVDVAFPVDYIFSHWTGEPSRLYGKGFGYSKVIGQDYIGNSWCSKGTCQTPPIMGSHGSLPDGYDTIVIGDLSSNRLAVSRFESQNRETLVVYLRGDDLAPTRSEYKWLKTLSGSVFSREIY